MLSAALVTLLEIPLGNFHKCILYLFVLQFWWKEKSLFSNAQKVNCNAETVTTFSRRGCSIWNALGLTQCFKKLLIWVSSSRQKAEAHTVTLPGRGAIFQHCSGKSQHRTSVFLLASSVPSTTGPFSDTRGNANALCTFLPTCSVGSSGSTHPMHGKSKKAEIQVVSATALESSGRHWKTPFHFQYPIQFVSCWLPTPPAHCWRNSPSSPPPHHCTKTFFFLWVPFLEAVRRELAHLTKSAEGSMTISSRNCSFLSLKS